MSIAATWAKIEAALKKRGLEMADFDEVPQPRRCTIRITSIPSDQERRGAIGSNVIRISWAIEVAITYDTTTDKRVEKQIAEDAESVVAAIYADANLTNHHFVGATIERNKASNTVTNTMRFDFQDQATL